jgi:hypothetical protein
MTPGPYMVHKHRDLFVPKPSCSTGCQRRSTRDLRQTVRACPLASTAVSGDCHSVRHSVAREPVTSDSCPPYAFQSARLGPGQGRRKVSDSTGRGHRARARAMFPAPDRILPG